MAVELQKEPCPLCGEFNLTSAAYCWRCRYRLPWADAVEGIVREHPPEKESILDRELKQIGLLPKRDLVCRFCDKAISVDDKQCPHCKRWLIARMNTELAQIDPWQKDFHEENVAHVDTIPPREKNGWLGLITLFLGAAIFVAVMGIGWLLWRLLP